MFTPDPISREESRARDGHPQQEHEPSNTLESSSGDPFHQQLATTIATPYYSVPRNSFADIINSGYLGSLPPDPYYGLQLERTYLLNYLEHENVKATELLREITPLEEDVLKGNYYYPKKR